MLKRLEGGLFSLQQLGVIIAFACVGDNDCVRRAQETLGSTEMSLSHVQMILREAAAAVDLTKDEISTDEEIGQMKNIPSFWIHTFISPF